MRPCTVVGRDLIAQMASDTVASFLGIPDDGQISTARSKPSSVIGKFLPITFWLAKTDVKSWLKWNLSG